MVWRVELDPAAERELGKIDPQTVRRILAFLHGRVAQLDDPRSIGEALKSSKDSVENSLPYSYLFVLSPSTTLRRALSKHERVRSVRQGIFRPSFDRLRTNGKFYREVVYDHILSWGYSGSAALGTGELLPALRMVLCVSSWCASATVRRCT